MLKIGTLVPDFVATSTEGKVVSMSALLGKKVVVFFFPKAFTSGCTLETRMLQNHYAEFVKMGTEIIGISTDDEQTQCAFAKQEQVTFPMIADPSKKISKTYDVLRPVLGFNKRVTYIVDPQGRISGMFHHELQIQKHIEEIRQHLLQMDPEKSASASQSQ